MKKNKFLPVSTKLTLLTLVLCMSAFFIPTAAYAQSPADTTPPTVSAKLSGETLHIEASDDNSGVDAVFIDGKRINYRVDSAVDVPLKDYAGTGAQVSVYAVDFAGNKSSVVQIKNPYYKAPTLKPTTPTEAKPTTKPSASASADPETPAEPKPFTPNGQATVTDNATNDGRSVSKLTREFYTFTTPNENVFYLVIDKQRDSDNVYFLNAVTESDLAALAEKPKETESAVPDPICSCKEKCELGAVDTTTMNRTENRRNDNSMTRFTDNSFELMMTQRATGGRLSKTEPPSLPPEHSCYGCAYGRDKPCLGVCLKELQKKEPKK